MPMLAPIDGPISSFCLIFVHEAAHLVGLYAYYLSLFLYTVHT